MNASDELLDVLDESGAPTGQTKPRNEVHRDGDWHRVLHLWVAREDGTVLLQRRSRHKELEPEKVDVTVGGHLSAGESVFDAVREAEEEIGLDVRPEQLAHLGTWRSERRYPNVVDREMQEVFALVCDLPLDRYSLNCREVYQLYEVPLARVIDLYRSGTPLPAAGYDCQLRTNDALLIEDDLIAQARGTASEQLEALAIWLAAGLETLIKE
ncbi:MAG: NUDIX domain-containing protein [Trueperaceae bacterium]